MRVKEIVELEFMCHVYDCRVAIALSPDLF